MSSLHLRVTKILFALVLVSASGMAEVSKRTAARSAPPSAESIPCKLKEPTEYRRFERWLNEDVRYIITERERADFMKICDEDEFYKFIEAFWARRDPTPGTPENEFKEEHYRRIAYTNEHFAARIPGWKTDRGRVFIVYGPPDIVYGPPDRIESHTANTMNTENKRYPYQVWTYRSIEGVGIDVRWEFVDACACGEYQLTVDPVSKKPVR